MSSRRCRHTVAQLSAHHTTAAHCAPHRPGLPCKNVAQAVHAELMANQELHCPRPASCCCQAAYQLFGRNHLHTYCLLLIHVTSLHVAVARSVHVSPQAHMTCAPNSVARRGLCPLLDAGQAIGLPPAAGLQSLICPLQVKPVVDITWFTFRLYKLTGRRGMAILYLYSFLGFAILRGVTPDFGALSGKEYFLEGAFRYPTV